MICTCAVVGLEGVRWLLTYWFALCPLAFHVSCFMLCGHSTIAIMRSSMLTMLTVTVPRVTPSSVPCSPMAYHIARVVGERQVGCPVYMMVQTREPQPVNARLTFM